MATILDLLLVLQNGNIYFNLSCRTLRKTQTASPPTARTVTISSAGCNSVSYIPSSHAVVTVHIVAVVAYSTGLSYSRNLIILQSRRGADYCDEPVCASVSVSGHPYTPGTTQLNFIKFSACGFSLVLFWQCCNTYVVHFRFC